jgi:hypothetical protein
MQQKEISRMNLQKSRLIKVEIVCVCLDVLNLKTVRIWLEQFVLDQPKVGWPEERYMCTTFWKFGLFSLQLIAVS